MPSTGFPLAGVATTSPMPGTKRELRFAQGTKSNSGQRRAVVLVGNKTTGTSSTDGLGDALNTVISPSQIPTSQDFEDRFGERSELNWMYRKYTEVDPNAAIYAVAVPENGSATAATRTYTFVNAATDTTTGIIEWGGERLEYTVNSGDTAITQAANATAKINADPYLPFSAAVGGSGSEHIVTITAANGGPRGDLVVGRVRIRNAKNVATTITAAAVTSGTGADDFTTALSALAMFEIYYHVAACTATSGVSTTDNGVGEYITFINTQALPANGKEQIVSFGLVGSQAQATTVATSSAANSVNAVFWHAENNDWTPAMIAAHCTAVKRSQEMLHPAANLAGYTNSENTRFSIPDPYDKNDRPTTAEQESDLDNGVTPIAFYPDGTSYIVRQVTSKSWTGSSATKDYRAREGHIPSVVHYFWNEVESRYSVAKQQSPHVAADPVRGQKPVKGVMYPSAVAKIISGVIDDFAGPAVGGIPLLDPSPDAVARMKASVTVVDMNDGTSAICDVEPVRHNLKGHFIINQTGPAY
jgi:phage tail sheath gpL-like